MKKARSQAGVKSILIDSFRLLRREPKLFLPKMLIAILYGIAIFIQAQVLLEVLGLASEPATIHATVRAAELLGIMILLVFYQLIVYILDVYVNSWYPALVRQLRKGNVSLVAAARESRKYSLRMFLSSLVPLVLAVILAIPFALAGMLFREFMLPLQLFFFVAVGYVLIMLFYLLYPVVMLGKKPASASISETVRLSTSNIRKVFWLSAIPFTVTVLKTITAFLASDPAFFILFAFLVLLTGVIYTYHMVVNPVLYLKVKK